MAAAGSPCFLDLTDDTVASCAAKNLTAQGLVKCGALHKRCVAEVLEKPPCLPIGEGRCGPYVFTVGVQKGGTSSFSRWLHAHSWHGEQEKKELHLYDRFLDLPDESMLQMIYGDGGRRRRRWRWQQRQEPAVDCVVVVDVVAGRRVRGERRVRIVH